MKNPIIPIVAALCLMFFLRLTIEGLLFPLSTSQGKNKLEFVHIAKNAGSSIENAAAKADIAWGACHFQQLPYCLHVKPDLEWTE